eukprot:scaffold238932_cov18-Tisochrysis_lutea.AAC.1
MGPGVPLLDPLHHMKFEGLQGMHPPPLHAHWQGPAIHDLRCVSRGCDGRGGRLGMPQPLLLPLPLPPFLPGGMAAVDLVMYCGLPETPLKTFGSYLTGYTKELGLTRPDLKSNSLISLGLPEGLNFPGMAASTAHVQAT